MRGRGRGKREAVDTTSVTNDRERELSNRIAMYTPTHRSTDNHREKESRRKEKNKKQKTEERERERRCEDT